MADTDRKLQPAQPSSILVVHLTSFLAFLDACRCCSFCWKTGTKAPSPRMSWLQISLQSMIRRLNPRTRWWNQQTAPTRLVVVDRESMWICSYIFRDIRGVSWLWFDQIILILCGFLGRNEKGSMNGAPHKTWEKSLKDGMKIFRTIWTYDPQVISSQLTRNPKPS